MRGEAVLDPQTGPAFAFTPPLPADTLYPKEQALLGLVLRERARGRRLLMYITHTERRDIGPRLLSNLGSAGLQVAVLKSDTVAAGRRKEWLASRVREGVDILICHPRLVQTGLDLIDWPSICWFETDYSVYVMQQQASRRSWRIGQQQPVEVTFMVHKGTLQAEALALVAAKMRSALMIEGELHEDGLAALEGDAQDMVLTLAHRLTGEHADGHSLEALFARRHQAETEAESYLASGDWDTADVSTGSDDVSSILDLSSCVATEAISGERDVACGDSGDASGRWLSSDELAGLIRRPKSRRRPIPDMQLPLFGD